jgi:kynurenine formamidase
MADAASSASVTPVVDLTQPLGPETVLWPGSPPFATEQVGDYEADGYYSRAITTPEHSGTHFDAPAHFAPDGWRAHEVPAERLVVPAAVVDVSAACERDPDFVVDSECLRRDEEEHGRLPEGGALLIRTGWDRLRGDRERYVEEMRFPGVAPSGAEHAIARGCVGIGIDTLGIDPGSEPSAPVHRITLPRNLWHLEGLVGLDALPPRGATLFVGALRLVDGSGTPARVLALVD